MYSLSRTTKLAGIILLIGILIEVLYDPISSANHALIVSRVQNQLPQERAKWEALGIKDYTFELDGNGRSICKPSAVIEVQNDVVIKVETKDAPTQPLSPEKWAAEGWGDEVFLCNYFHFTMSRIFDMAESVLRDYPSSIMRADFDPQHGFLTNFSFGLYVGHGLLRPKISDCCNVLTIKNFQPILKKRSP